jgi:phosphatidate cytidylyltransferase
VPELALPAWWPLGPAASLLVAGVLGLLLIATPLSRVLLSRASSEPGRRTLGNVRQRVISWWWIFAVVGLALLFGRIGALVLFAILSTLALREFTRLLDLHAVDRRVLLWVAFALVPLQYLVLGLGWYGMFLVLVPVYGFVFLAARAVVADDTENFLARTATLQWVVFLSVYSLSHLPALLTLELETEPEALLLWFVIVVQLGDVFQYIWGKTLGKSRLAPKTSPNKTWAGAIGGIASTGALGGLLSWATPLAAWQAAGLALLCATLGLLGDLVLSAIKRDGGVKDFGALLPGHGGVLDRVDSLVLSAPVFFHLVRFFTTG